MPSWLGQFNSGEVKVKIKQPTLRHLFQNLESQESCRVALLKLLPRRDQLVTLCRSQDLSVTMQFVWGSTRPLACSDRRPRRSAFQHSLTRSSCPELESRWIP